VRPTACAIPAGAIVFQLFLACNVLAALIHPVFMAALCWSLFAASQLQLVSAMHAAPVFVATLCCGYASTIALDVVGLRRRRLLAHAWVLLLTPLYWFLFGRRLARVVPAASRSAGLGEDRARTGKELALGRVGALLNGFQR